MSDRERLSVHEAGHAVVGGALGFQPEATLWHDAEFGLCGYTFNHRPPARGTVGHAGFAWAGPIAESRADCEWPLDELIEDFRTGDTQYFSRSDLDSIRECPQWREACIMAARILDGRRTLLRAVARQLLETGSYRSP